MAECILNRRGAGRFRGFSAGSQPLGKINPDAVKLLKEFDHATDHLRSKSWMEFATPEAEPMDFVFTVCDNAASETCPIWPGRPMTAHWGVPDPAAARGTDSERRTVFVEVYRALERRVESFVNVPIGSLNRISLTKRLDEIGAVP